MFRSQSQHFSKDFNYSNNKLKSQTRWLQGLSHNFFLSFFTCYSLYKYSLFVSFHSCSSTDFIPLFLVNQIFHLSILFYWVFLFVPIFTDFFVYVKTTPSIVCVCVSCFFLHIPVVIFFALSIYVSVSLCLCVCLSFSLFSSFLSHDLSLSHSLTLSRTYSREDAFSCE